jgi:hypothetical protein
MQRKSRAHTRAGRALSLLVVVLVAACEAATPAADAGGDLPGAVDTASDAAGSPDAPPSDVAPPRDTTPPADATAPADTAPPADTRPPEDVPPPRDVENEVVAGDTTTVEDVGPTEVVEPTDPNAPVLSSATARQVGARGHDLRIAVAGLDRDKNTRFLRIRLFQGDEPAPLFQVEATGAATHEAVFTFDSLGEVFGRATFAGLVTVRGLLKSPVATPTRLTVELVDSTGLASRPVEAPLVAQQVAALEETCDPFFVETRCEEGLICRSSRCQLGPAPWVTRISYFVDAGGPRILVEGVDSDDDFSSLLFTYFDSEGQQVMVDWDEDGEPETEEDFRDISDLRGTGSFFLRLDLPAGFPDHVAGVMVVATDSRDQMSDPKRTQRTIAPVRATDQVCDPRGFDLCRVGDRCLKTPDGQYMCQMIDDYRARICETAPFLPLDGTPVSGVAFGPSGYDPPPLCAANDPTDRPEGLARVRLAARADRVVITTDHPGTAFDTVLYVYAGCGNTSLPPLDCVDDIAGPPTKHFSTVELTNVGAGDYLVVIDAWGQGGAYQVSARVE